MKLLDMHFTFNSVELYVRVHLYNLRAWYLDTVSNKHIGSSKFDRFFSHFYPPTSHTTHLPRSILLTNTVVAESKGSTPLIPKPAFQYYPEPVPATYDPHNLTP